MATLILTAVGTAVGGPIGGAIGAIIGQSADQALFAPKARHGPRLGDLAVQTSSYGTAIPKIFGYMRVAGTVIWSTDLIESRSSSGGGKGQPKTVNYSYSASFAVALSGRPIRAVRRIWADGKLLRGLAGDFKSATGYRLYLGTEDQEPDPLMAAAEGAGQTPAFRGIAYAMFEDFQLEDYGNRIPSLTFEVEADSGTVEIGTIAEILSAGAVVAGETPDLAGYAASGDSIRGAIEALSDVVPLSLIHEGAALRLSAQGGTPTDISEHDECKGREVTRRAAGQVPDEVSIAYYDTGRDYQAGLQRAFRGRGQTPRADRRALPAALSAGEAKSLAEFRLAILWAARSRATLRLGWRHCDLRPGARLQLETASGIWKIDRATFGPMVLTLELRRVPGPLQTIPIGASAGRVTPQPDLVHGPTTLRFHDLPLSNDGTATRPLLFALAAGEQAGWRRAMLMASFDGGATWLDAGSTAGPAVLGTAITSLAAGGSTLFDDRSSVEVELLNDAMWLENRSDDALIGGANVALVGNELLQFGQAAALGGRRYRLSRLLRGRRGTEWAAFEHQVGESFALIAPNDMTVIETPREALGGEASLIATSIGDLSAASAEIRIEGEAVRPPFPVHLRATRQLNGDLHIAWTRRSRQGWSWISGSDTPLGEEKESYRVMLSGQGSERIAVTEAPNYLYSADEQTVDGNAGPVSIAVSQIGTFAVSRAAILHTS